MGGLKHKLEDLVRGLGFAAVLVAPSFISTQSIAQQPGQDQPKNQEQPPKKDIPDENTQNNNAGQIRQSKTFRDEYSKPGNASKISLADILVGKAEDPANDDKLKFSYYKEAARVAAEGLDVKKAFGIVDNKIVAAYKVRDVNLKYEMFNTAKRFATSAEHSASIADPAFELFDAVYARLGDYKSAIKLASDIKGLPKVSKEIQKKAQELMDEVKKVESAEEAYIKDNTDAKAANIFAQYTGFRRHKWDEAKKIMANGNNETLKVLINMEVMSPKTPDMQHRVALKYLETGKTVKGVEKELYDGRCVHWCNTALNNGADALLKDNIKTTLSEVGASAEKGNIVDLLKMIDPTKDAVAGKWEFKDGKLVSDKTPGARLQFNYHPPEEYDFRAVFTRVQGQEGVVILLSRLQKDFHLGLSGYENKISGFGEVKGAATNSNSTTVQSSIQNGQSYTVLVEVRKDGLKAYLNGSLLTQHKTDYSDLTLPQYWALRGKNMLGVGSHESPTMFHKVEVKELNVKGK